MPPHHGRGSTPSSPTKPSNPAALPRRRRSVRTNSGSGKSTNSPRNSAGTTSSDKSAGSVSTTVGAIASTTGFPPRHAGTARQPTVSESPALTSSQEAQTQQLVPAPIAPPEGEASISPRSSAGALRVHQYRDSTSSISSDPFFRSYQTPDSLRTPAESVPNAIQPRFGPLPPRLARRPSLETLSPTTVEQQPSPLGAEVTSEPEFDTDMPEVNLVVVGAAGVGKSTFIQKALGLRQLPATFIASRKLALDGVVHTVRLIELELHGLDILSGRQLRWPTQIDGIDVPHVDGAMVLYDVISQRSVTALPEILDAMSRARLPFVLVSCKCDVPISSRRVNHKTIEQARANLDGVELIQTSANVPESQKRCMGAVLRRVLMERHESPKMVPGRRRATSTAHSERSMTPRPTIKHSRTSSELSGSRLKVFGAKSVGPAMGVKVGLGLGVNVDAAPLTAKSDLFGQTRASPVPPASAPAAAAAPVTLPPRHSETQAHPTTANVAYHPRAAAASGSPTTNLHSQPPTPTSPRSKSRHGTRSASTTRRSSKTRSPVVISPAPSQSSTSYFPPTSVGRSSRPRKHRSESSKKKPMQSFLNMDDDNDDVSRTSDDIPILDREDGGRTKRPSRGAGYTLEELVDRLLAKPISKADSNFAAIFLCLYRKFAAPSELLDLIMRRFREMDSKESQQLLRVNEQLRYLGVLSQWLAGYPGDFANTRTRKQLTLFVADLWRDPAFAPVAKELRMHLDVVVEDNDGGWGRSDVAVARDRTATMESFYSTSSVHSTTSTLHANSSAEDVTDEVKDMTPEDGGGTKSARTSGAPSNSSSEEKSADVSNGSSQTLLNSMEHAEREAQTLAPTPRIPLTKLQWHQFDDLVEEDIAQELTRIDWVMFCSIRPRDLVRHVSLPLHQKETKSLENVNRMISHFNHVAYWVSNMILLREKPKHRAKTLEKFMSVAWKLRYLNNYNSLGAVIAGINGSAVHRLAQTRELVMPQAQKDFMRLEILMGTQKSHFAYRLAWENTSSGRIPFLPLHRRDLVSAEEGNRTFIDERKGRINWKKFEVMGEVILGVQKSQNTSYTTDLERNVEIQRLVLETVLQKDDEELYDRSVHLEAPGTISGDVPKKKFAWFAR